MDDEQPIPTLLDVFLSRDVHNRAVLIPGLESAPEYDRSMILKFVRGDSGSGSFQVDPLESAPVLESAPLVLLTPLLELSKPSRACYFLF